MYHNCSVFARNHQADETSWVQNQRAEITPIGIDKLSNML